MSSSVDEGIDAKNQPFAQFGYDLMGACFEVHRELGGGMLEEIYQESLERELSMRGIPFLPKQELILFYKEHQLDKRYIPDLLVADHVLVELKSVNALLPDHEAQLFNYMRITRQPVGYLINFGPMDKVEWKRFVISQYAPTCRPDGTANGR